MCRTVFYIFFLLPAATCYNDHQLRVSKRSTSADATCLPKFRIFSGHSACLSKSSAAQTLGVNDTERNVIVDLHNFLRQNVRPPAADMLKMYWDEELALVAQRWADVCVQEHDSVRFIPGRFSVGQNIGIGYATFEDAIHSWDSEKTEYNLGMTITSSNFLAVGHYTQLVWAQSNRLGCGLTKCGKTLFYVCNYAPAGNVIPFSQPYVPCPTLAACQILRDCGNLTCHNGGIMNKTSCTCVCNVSPASTQGPTCELNCTKADPDLCGTSLPLRRSNCKTYHVSSVCPKLCQVCLCLNPGNNSTCSGADRLQASPLTGPGLYLLAVVLLGVCRFG